MMSDPRANVTTVNPQLEHLVELAQDHTPLGQLAFLDAIMNATIQHTTRPGDIEKCAEVLYELTTELAYTRAKVNA